MANHRRKRASIISMDRHVLTRVTAVIASLAVLAGVGLASRGLYQASTPEAKPITSYSATDPDAVAASRGETRDLLGKRGANANTTYITVKVNGKSRTILGTNFTDVKSVLDQGDITLDPNDTVSPSLTTKVSESTVITIERAGTQVETAEKKIPFNVVKKKTDALPAGQEKVQTEGKEGIVETTSLVTRSAGKVVSSNVFTSYVKKDPVNKVILVGTGVASAPSQSTGSSNGASDAATDLGTTVPAGEMQEWAHKYLLDNGYSEADFTATVFIVTHESGWQVNATNPYSGAYGLPQALPGSKMVSAGADWATNYQTQLKWFWSYCNQRYGSIQNAYAYWVANKTY